MKREPINNRYRNPAVRFSWLSATLFTVAIAFWSILALHTFRDPDDTSSSKENLKQC